MNKLNFLFLALIAFFGFAFLLNTKSAEAQNLQNCLSMQLSTSVVEGNYSGGPLTVSCPGDNGVNCTGSSKTVMPGGSVTLNNCSCPPYASGCINIPSSPITSSGCTSQLDGPTCGTNGNTIEPRLRIYCPEPPTPTPGSECPNVNPDGSRNQCVTGSSCRSGQTPKPGGDWACQSGGHGDKCCTINPTPTPVSRCPNVNPDGSTNECVRGNSCGSNQTRKADGDYACTNFNGTSSVCCTNNPQPTSTPTPTPRGDACGVSCTRDSQCQGSQYSSTNRCIECVNNRCAVPPGSPPQPTPTNTPRPPVGQPNPTATPTNTPTPGPQCGGPCDPGGGGNQCPQGCPICDPGPGGGGTCVAPTPTPTSPPAPTNTPIPTPTPTPDFNKNMCDCDSMNVQQVVMGQPIQVEAFAKVEGENTGKAEMQFIRFSVFKGDPSAGNRIEKLIEEDRPVTVVDNTPNLVRYRADWSTSPQIEVGEEYRIMANIQAGCVAKTAALQSEMQRVVLAERDENVGFFGQIRNFFAGLFGGGSEVDESEGVQVEEQEENRGPLSFLTDIFSPQQSTSDRDQLQLDTFQPAQMEKEACNIMKFKFDSL